MVSRALRLCPIRWRDWARIRRVLSCRLHKRRPARDAAVFLLPPSVMMHVPVLRSYGEVIHSISFGAAKHNCIIPPILEVHAIV